MNLIRNLSRFCRVLARLVLILFLGIIGGGIFCVLILPKIIENPYFEKFQFTKAFKREVISYPKEEIIIQENTALKNAVEKAEKVVMGISTESKGKILTGSVLILTSDGLAVTLDNLLTSQSEIYYQGEILSFQILKRDQKENLVLIKVEKSNLSTSSFANLEKFKLGERVFLIGKIITPENGTQIVVNEGIIKSFNDKFITTNIFENETLGGCPLFDIEGNIVGLNIIEKGKEVKTIPISRIREFTGL